MGTIFSKIIKGEIPCEKVFEVHILLIPKKEIPSLQAVTKEDLPIISEAIEIAQKIAVQMGIAEGYRVVTNIGKEGGQEIPHLHFHLIGGRPLGRIA